MTASTDRAAQMRRKVKQVVESSGLLLAEVARLVFSVDPTSVWRWLNGGEIPETKRRFLERLESVRVDGELVHIIVRRTPLGTVAPLGVRPPIPASGVRRGETALAGVDPDSPIARLDGELDAWVHARRIREYVAAVRAEHRKIEPQNNLGRWLFWMERHADAIDPVFQAPDCPAPHMAVVGRIEHTDENDNLDQETA